MRLVINITSPSSFHGYTALGHSLDCVLTLNRNNTNKVLAFVEGEDFP